MVQVQEELLAEPDAVYVPVVEEPIKEEVLGIELQEELDIATPYMEEEM